MASSVYDLAVNLNLSAAGFMSTTATVMSAMRLMERQAEATGSSVNKMGVVAGAALTAVGVGGVLAMKSWISHAAQMQDQLVQVGAAAHATSAELATLNNLAFTVAGQTQYSAPQVAQMAQLMARGGFRDPSGRQDRMQVITGALPQFARAAEILQHFQGSTYQETVAALTQQAHQFGVYSGAALAQNVAMATGAALLTHMTTQQQVNVLRYIAPAVRSLGVTPLDALALAATANQTGLTANRGGSTLGALYRQILPGGSAAHIAALDQMQAAGGGAFFQRGQFVGTTRMLQIIAAFEQNAALTPAQRGEIAKNALGVQGSQAAAVLGSLVGIQQFLANRAQLTRDTPAWLVGTQGALNATAIGQWNTLKTNIASIETMLGQALLPTVVSLTTNLRLLTDHLIAFGQQHPAIVQIAAAATVATTAFALLAGPLLIVTSAIGTVSALSGAAVTVFGVLDVAVTALSGGFGIMAIAAGALDLVFSPITLTILGIAGAVGLVVLVFKNWSSISGVVGNLLGWLGGKLHDFLVWLGLLHDQGNGQQQRQQAQGGASGASAETTYGGQTGQWVQAGRARVFVPNKAASTHHTVHHTHTVTVNGHPIPGQPGTKGHIAAVARQVAEVLSADFGAENKWQANDLYGGTDLSPLGIG